MVPGQSDAKKPQEKIAVKPKASQGSAHASAIDKRTPVVTLLELVMMRNNFYHNAYRQLMQIFLLLLIFNVGLVVFGFAESKWVTPPTYFFTSAEGVPLKLIPINQRNVSDPALLQWAVEATTDAYTFNFVNYREQLQESRAYFTKNGYATYLNAIKVSRNLEAIKKRKLLVYAIQTGDAVVLQTSDTNPDISINGAYTWVVQIPMSLTYENVTEKFPQNTVLTATIVRQSTLVAEKGLGIHSFVLRMV